MQGIIRTTIRDRSTLERNYVYGKYMYIMHTSRTKARADYMCTGNSGEGVDIYIIDRYDIP